MTILITGANRGIGRALFDHYSAAGKSVVGTTRSKATDNEDGGTWATLDVTDPASIKELADTMAAHPLELLICNAGVYLDKGQPLDAGYPAQMWAETFATNVTGVFETIQALLPNLSESRGKIAIISSQMGSDTLASGGSYIYRASKAAVLNLGRNLASDLKPKGVAVGIYHPGWVQTDMGGADASIDTDEAARGLLQRFDALELAATGCFETWDGRELPF